MSYRIEQQTARQIVKTVKDVSGCDINFILPDGTVLASTDLSRIGSYHEIGHRAARETENIEVSERESYPGTKPGVNLPFLYRGELIAVIGISGAPEKVRKYAYLAQKITALLLRERELDADLRSRRESACYLSRSLLRGVSVPHDFLKDFLGEHALSEDETYRCILIRLDSRYNPANISMMEQRILHALDAFRSPLYTYEYPNEYYFLVPERSFRKNEGILERLAGDNAGILRIGAGREDSLYRMKKSGRDAEIALAAGTASVHGNYVKYEELHLEILLASIEEENRKRFTERTAGKLSEKQREILSCYFSHNCSLKESAEALFMHTNTLQYQLDKIARETGYNPRVFRDAVTLSLGIELLSRFHPGGPEMENEYPGKKAPGSASADESEES